MVSIHIYMIYDILDICNNRKCRPPITDRCDQKNSNSERSHAPAGKQRYTFNCRTGYRAPYIRIVSVVIRTEAPTNASPCSDGEYIIHTTTATSQHETTSIGDQLATNAVQRVVGCGESHHTQDWRSHLFATGSATLVTNTGFRYNITTVETTT